MQLLINSKDRKNNDLKGNFKAELDEMITIKSGAKVKLQTLFLFNDWSNITQYNDTLIIMIYLMRYVKNKIAVLPIILKYFI